MNRTHAVLLGLILCLATAVRAYGLSSVGFWTDEFCTLSEANGHGLQLDAVPTDRIVPPGLPVCTRLVDARPAWAIVPTLARADTHPPIYFLLVRLWEQLFGDSESAVRSLTVAWSVAAVGLLFYAARPDVGVTAALWACLVMAVASPQVQFALEARNYTPAMALSLAAVVSWRRVVRGPTVGGAAVLAGCLLAGMLTHYYFALPAVVLAFHTAVTVRGRSLACVAAAFGVGAVVFLSAWGWAVVSQLPVFGRGTEWLSDAAASHTARALTWLARLPVRWVADVDGAWVAVVGGVLLGAVPVAYVASPAVRLWALWVAVPTAVVAGGDLLHGTTQLTLLRYTLFATPGAYVLLAAAGRWTGWAVPMVAVVGGLLALPSAYAPPWKIDFRTPAEVIGRKIGPGDGLVVSGPNEVTAEMAFAACQHYWPRVPAASAILTRPADAEVVSRLSACRRVWVLWLWDDRPIRAFVPGWTESESGVMPHFGTVASGRVARPQGGGVRADPHFNVPG